MSVGGPFLELTWYLVSGAVVGASGEGCWRVAFGHENLQLTWSWHWVTDSHMCRWASIVTVLLA